MYGDPEYHGMYPHARSCFNLFPPTFGVSTNVLFYLGEAINLKFHLERNSYAGCHKTKKSFQAEQIHALAISMHAGHGRVSYCYMF
jgi:hypothetical protein